VFCAPPGNIIISSIDISTTELKPDGGPWGKSDLPVASVSNGTDYGGRVYFGERDKVLGSEFIGALPGLLVNIQEGASGFSKEGAIETEHQARKALADVRKVIRFMCPSLKKPELTWENSEEFKKVNFTDLCKAIAADYEPAADSDVCVVCNKGKARSASFGMCYIVVLDTMRVVHSAVNQDPGGEAGLIGAFLSCIYARTCLHSHSHTHALTHSCPVEAPCRTPAVHGTADRIATGISLRG
jgi:hypothetical protein